MTKEVAMGVSQALWVLVSLGLLLPQSHNPLSPPTCQRVSHAASLAPDGHTVSLLTE